MGIFEFKKVNNDETELLKEVYRIRYQVYCDEWGFEKPEAFPDRLEYDEYDGHAVHFVVCLKETCQVIGTIRIILHSDVGLPLEKHCLLERDIASSEKKYLGEISRLAVSKEFSKRYEDRIIHDGKNFSGEALTSAINEEKRHRENEIVTGLYRCVCVESDTMGLKYWYAVMARGLFLLLKRRGIVFEPIGPEIEYHGLRRPYLGTIENIKRSNPELFV